MLILALDNVAGVKKERVVGGMLGLFLAPGE